MLVGGFGTQKLARNACGGVMQFKNTGTPTEAENVVEIDFKKGKGSYKRISVDDLLAGKIIANEINGKIVLLGKTGAENLFVTPVYDNKINAQRRMSDTEILATLLARYWNFKVISWRSSTCQCST